MNLKFFVLLIKSKKRKTPGYFFIANVIVMTRWTPKLAETKDLTGSSVVCELQFHYQKKYYYVLFADWNNWLSYFSSSSNTTCESETSKVVKNIMRGISWRIQRQKCFVSTRFGHANDFSQIRRMKENFNWGVQRKLNVILFFVNVCCFLIFLLLNCVSDSTLGHRMIDRCCTL